MSVEGKPGKEEVSKVAEPIPATATYQQHPPDFTETIKQLEQRLQKLEQS